jgi:hypothetical protein
MQNDPATVPKNIIRRSSVVERTVLTLLIGSSLTGVGITESLSTDDYGYWRFMIATFGVTSIASGFWKTLKSQWRGGQGDADDSDHSLARVRCLPSWNSCFCRKQKV